MKDKTEQAPDLQESVDNPGDPGQTTVAVDPSDAQSEAESSAAAAAQAERRNSRSSGGGLALLSLLIALGALGVSGWLYWQSSDGGSPDAQADEWRQAVVELQSSATHQAEQLDQQAATLESAWSDLEQRISNQLAASESRMGQISEASAQDSVQALAELQIRFDGIEQRQASAERLLGELGEIGRGGDTQMRMAESAWLMHLADERLVLFGDSQMAARALELADSQLRSLSDPRLAAVRRTLAADIEALKTHPLPDIPSLSGRLLALEDAVASWPLRTELTPSDSEPIAQTVGESVTEDDGEGFFAGVGEVLGKLVVVRRDSRTDTPILAPDEIRWLRENVRRELALARLAVQGRELGLARQSLHRVESWVNQYFDSESEAGIAIVADLQELSELLLEAPLPTLQARAELEAMLAVDAAGSAGSGQPER